MTKVNETAKIKNLSVAGVSMLVGVPLILHQRKWPSRTTHKKGLKNKRKGGSNELAATDPYHVDKQHPKDLRMQVTVLCMYHYPMHHNLMYHLPHM